jgi:hypothetical protein
VVFLLKFLSALRYENDLLCYHFLIENFYKSSFKSPLMGEVGLQHLDTIVGKLRTNPAYFSMYEPALLYSQCHAVENFLHMEACNRAATEKPWEPLPTPYAPPEARKRFHEAWACLAAGITPDALLSYGPLLTGEKGTRTELKQNHPEPDKIYDALESFALRLYRPTAQHPVLRAVDAGLNVLQILPFAEGNHFAAHFLQNFCLHERGYPAANLAWEQYDSYTQLSLAAERERTLRQRSGRYTDPQTPGPHESSYQNYMIDALLSTAVEIEQTLKEKQAYNITIHATNGDAMHAYHVLEQYAASHDLTLIPAEYVPRDATEHPTFHVAGNASMSQLRGLLSRSNGRRAPAFDIRPAKLPDDSKLWRGRE